MAGISVLHLTQPQDTLDKNESPVSSGKVEEIDSHQATLAITEPGVVSVSPQGKGVGVFGMDDGHKVDSQKSEGPLKDPKVHLWFTAWMCMINLALY